MTHSTKRVLRLSVAACVLAGVFALSGASSPFAPRDAKAGDKAGGTDKPDMPHRVHVPGSAKPAKPRPPAVARTERALPECLSVRYDALAGKVPALVAKHGGRTAAFEEEYAAVKRDLVSDKALEEAGCARK